MKKILFLAIGFLLRPIFKNVPVKENIWIFGAQDGQSFVDNSKYLFEYVVKNHPEIDAVWITKSSNVLRELQSQKLPVLKNISIKGIWYVIRAQVVVFSTSRSDILFIYPKSDRKIINLWHGMPIKKIAYDYTPHKPENKSLKGKIWDTFVASFQHNQVTAIISTSSFYNQILKSSFRNDNVYATGQPRTDAFYQWNKIEIKKKFGFSEEEKIITYMPTHRSYGSGQMNPRILKGNEHILKFFEKNNVKLIWKFHKNMLDKYDYEEVTCEQIVDLTRENIDPQELLFITDILITDYSSCYIDFLLLNRPIVFYHYDDYEKFDNELYFSISDNNPGPIVKDETELKEVIKKIIQTDDHYPEQRISYLDKYHDYQDGNSSERVFELATNFL